MFLWKRYLFLVLNLSPELSMVMQWRVNACRPMQHFDIKGTIPLSYVHPLQALQDPRYKFSSWRVLSNFIKSLFPSAITYLAYISFYFLQNYAAMAPCVHYMIDIISHFFPSRHRYAEVRCTSPASVCPGRRPAWIRIRLKQGQQSGK